MHVEALRLENLSVWDELVEKSPHGTIFHFSWWLEATGYDYEILACRDTRGKVVGGIPLPRKKRKGLTLYHSPKLTPYLGPIFDLSGGSTAHEQVSLMRHAGESIARAIEGYDSFDYDLGPSAPDLQGFFWAGFRAELAYTFRFESRSVPEQILASLALHHRRVLDKAQRHHLRVEVADSFDAFMELHRQTYSRQGQRLPYEEGLPRRLWAAARARKRAEIYLGCTPAGDPIAGLLVVHDRHSSYLLMAGGNPQTRSTGAGNLVEWHAIRDSLLAGRAFDFEGSAIRGVEHHYRRWGATPAAICTLRKAGTVKGALARVALHWRNYRQRL